MHKNLILHYPAAVKPVAAMLTDLDYQHERANRSKLSDVSVTLTQAETDVVVQLSGAIPQHLMPSLARKFINSPLSFTLTQTWHAPAADGSYSGDTHVKAQGAPVQLRAQHHLCALDQSRSELNLEIDFTVSIPLLGRSVEERLLPLLVRAGQYEEELGAQWLSTH